MNHEYQINEKYKDFLSFLLQIPAYFQKNTQTIHKARNELKIIPFANVETVVKSFKVPHLLNRIIYAFFRDSKAKKSYEYSLKIKDFTPSPIGYIEFYSSLLLHESYFVSERFAYDFTIREPLLDAAFEEREEIFKAFARFSYALHEADILHQDYSPGNILIKKEGDIYIFKIVDINRMEFKKLSYDDRLKNFSKLWASDEALRVILKEYARLSQEDEETTMHLGVLYSQKHKKRKNFKKWLKGEKIAH